jgi:signal transduction histidine kinase/ActR/RegA family two-component response regulator
MKRIFSPAINIFDRFKYSIKFIIIAVFFLAALVITLELLIVELGAENTFTKKERIGLEYLNSLFNLQRDVEEYKNLKSDNNELIASLNKVDSLNDQYSIVLGTEDAWKKVKEDTSKLIYAKQAEDDQATFSQCDTIVNDISESVTLIGNSSNLILDPELDSYHLTDIVLGCVPSMVECIERVRYQVNSAIKAGSITAKDKNSLIETMAQIKLAIADIDLDTTVAIGKNSALSAPLAQDKKANVTAVDNFITAISDKMINSDRTSLTEEEFTDLSNSAFTTSSNYHQKVVVELDKLFTTRIAQYNKKEAIAVGSSICGVLLAMYFFVGLYLSLGRKVAELEQVTSKMADGDLMVRVQFRSNDELNKIGQAFNKMAGDLGRAFFDINEQSSKLAETAKMLKETNLELLASNKNLQELDKLKSDFLSTVSHELRTPLTSVLGFAKIIKKRLEDVIFPLLNSDDKKIQRATRQVKENIEIIVAEGERLTFLINDVLDLAKMEAGRTEWKRETVNLAEVIDRATTVTRAIIEQKGLKLIKDIEADLPCVRGDNDKLIQAVINLISNAVKFTGEGSVICRARNTVDKITVSVIDTGMGIAKEDQAKVFEKFKQVGDTLTDKPKGTGLGLPICKQIIEHHGGQIWVESELGKGCNFSFTLYLEGMISTAVSETDGRTLIKEDSKLSAQSTGGERKNNILVADDDPSIRVLIRQELEAGGYLVREAKDGLEVISEVKKEEPGLIILDVIMPGMSGFDVAAVLKNDPGTMDIPIVIVSVVEDKERGYRIGIDRHFTKPVDTEELLKAVGQLVAQGSSRKKVLVG